MKDFIISKELLSEVLNEKVEVVDIKTSIDDCTIPTNEIRYYPELSTSYKSINIYEFAFECKEWLRNKVSNLCSGFDNGDRPFCHIERLSTEDRFYEDSEVESIIKACTYVLEKRR